MRIPQIFVGGLFNVSSHLYDFCWRSFTVPGIKVAPFPSLMLGVFFHCLRSFSCWKQFLFVRAYTVACFIAGGVSGSPVGKLGRWFPCISGRSPSLPTRNTTRPFSKMALPMEPLEFNKFTD